VGFSQYVHFSLLVSKDLINKAKVAGLPKVDKLCQVECGYLHSPLVVGGTKVDCWGKGLRVCLEHLRILNFAPDFSVCCGACLYSHMAIQASLLLLVVNLLT
jgi:hypothetical protein